MMQVTGWGGTVLLRWLASAFVSLISASTPLQANEPGLSPEQVVRRYSRTVACQVYPAVEGFKQFAAVQLEPGYADGGFGAVWLVGWTGDLGCMGGNGTQLLQMNLVMQNGFSSRAVSPVVIDPRPLPDLVMNGLREMQFSNGVLTVRGTTGGKAYGTHTELSVRYRWHGGWNPAGRFKRLP